jgi:glutathione peroxidase-family protein
MLRIPCPKATAGAVGRARHAAAFLASSLAVALAWPAAVHAACGTVAEKPPVEADSPADVLDRPARAWTFDRWVDSQPLTLASLRGKVVLMRWFNTGCKYCGNTLPALETLRTRYASQGLVVVGVYHPKPIGKVSDAFVRKTARALGFRGPLAVDETWSTLDRWWLDGHDDRNWTSVSFLIDRNGIVRWAHGGGEYHPSTDPRHASCDASYAELEHTLRRLLDDRAASR